MSEDLSDLMENFKKIIDNGSVPENLKEILNNISISNNSSVNMDETSEATSNNTVKSSFNNIDINTILKMKTVIDSINNNDDPRSNLLYSLKPYLRKSKKNKLDQYINILNITKIAELINNKKENLNNDQ